MLITPSFLVLTHLLYYFQFKNLGLRENPGSFFMPTFRQKLLHAKEQFGVVDDQKLQMTLIGLADKYSYNIREMIRRAYDDPELAAIYRGWRTARAFDKGGKHHKEIIRFPNGHVYDFVDTVLTALYGPKWLQNKKALKHDLVRPWHISKI